MRMNKNGSKERQFFNITNVISMAIILVLFLSPVLIFSLSRVIEKSIIKESRADVKSVTNAFHEEFYVVGKFAGFLAGSPEVVKALSSPGEESMNEIKTILRRYQKDLGICLCYVIDKKGVLIASSDISVHEDHDASHIDSEYFSEAVASGKKEYFVLEGRSLKRKFYVSHAVRNSGGEVLGVAVVEMHLDEFEEILKAWPLTFIANPDGIIFLSSDPFYLFNSLWPINGKREKELLESGRFGQNPFKAILPEKAGSGAYVNFNGKKSFLTMDVLNEDGWYAVQIRDAGPVLFAIYAGTSAAAVMIFFMVLILFYVKKNRKYISRLKTHEKDMMLLAKEWSDTFDAVPDMVSIQDTDYRIIRANKAFLDAFGLDSEEVEGKHCYEVVHGTDKPWGECPFGEVLATREANVREFFEPHLNMYLEVSTSPIIGENGELSGVVHIAKDITNRKKSEEDLQEAKDYAELLFELTPSATFTVDTERRITSWNRKAEEVTGFSRYEVLGKDCFVFADQPCKKRCGLFCDEVMKPVSGKECTIFTKYKELRYISKSVDVLRNKKGEIIGGIESFEDITDRKDAEKVLMESVKLKSDFTSMVSHELRTPLTAIREGIGIVLDGLTGDINDDQRDFLDTAKRNVDRLSRLINDVLDFTKLEAGKMMMKIKENSIETAISEVVNLQKTHVNEKGLYIETDIEEGVPLINFDSDRIIQVITNLVNNAIKFTGKGGITLRVSKDEKNVIVSVEDTGPGIKEEDMERLFQEFIQLENKNERKTGGTGLGLAISKKIIKQHGGKIWVESEYGKGTSFRFSLPIKRKHKIVIIDDDKEAVKLYRELLKKYDFDSDAAYSGMKGLEKIREKQPDIVVVDMKLPDINGYEVIGRMKSEKELATIPILAISGYESELDSLERNPLADTIPRLAKPFDNNAFISIVISLIENLE